MRVMITGGTGFIGGSAARALLAAGHSVTILARSRAKAAPIEALGATVVIGDIRDPDSVSRAATAAGGCKVVIHAAGVPRPASWRTFRAVHIQGTQNVIRAAQSAGANRLVHLASQAVTFRGVDQLHMDEASPYPTRFIDPYSATKAEGEQLALAAHNSDRMQALSLRPAVVWGRGDTTVLPIMARLAKSPLGVPMCGDGRNIEATTHIDNLVQAILLAVSAPIPQHTTSPGPAYLIADPFRITWKEFLAAQIEAAGVRPRFTRIPRAIAIPSAWILDHTAASLGLPVPLATFGLRNALTSRIICTTRAHDELGYTPHIGLAEGLADLRQWVKGIGGPSALMKCAGKGAAAPS